MSTKIICPSCNQESMIKKEKVFKGFLCVGEHSICAFCGAKIIEKEITKVNEKKPAFLEDSQEKNLCSTCCHYVINPWTQKCVLYNKYVEALDSCQDFKKRSEKKGKETP